MGVTQGAEVRVLRRSRWVSLGVYQRASIETDYWPSEPIFVTVRFEKWIRPSKFSRRRFKFAGLEVEGFAITQLDAPYTSAIVYFETPHPIWLENALGDGAGWVAAGVALRGGPSFKRGGTGRVSGR